MMERKGGCLLVPRYAAAAAGSAVAAGQAPGMSWQMGRIMLKFRPIAPKPAAMAPEPTPAPVAATATGTGRGKRKAIGGGRRERKPKKAATVAPVAVAPVAPEAVRTAGEKESDKEKSLSSRSSSSSAMTSVDSSPPSPTPPASQRPPATLPLMPVSPAEGNAEAVAVPARSAGAHPPVAPPRPTASCWVTVEDVTSTWRDGEAPSAAAAASSCIGGGDGEAPAFVSDRWGRVTWANVAFTRAVYADESGEGVALAGALPAWGTCAGFTCRVRVVRHSGPGRRRCGGDSVVAPCDVWRLDADGCYLWRLDLQAALTLGGLLP